MSGIQFFSEDLEFELSNPEIIAEWIEQVAGKEGVQVESLNYIFCSDHYLHQINVSYLNHDDLTDIITFDLRDQDQPIIEGEIYISIDRIKDNAAHLNQDFHEELHRVIIHGVLHLLGFKDKTREEKQDMRKKEEACLSLLN